MRGNLMAFSDHTRDNGWIWSSGVYCPLPKVVAGNEKRRLEPIALKYI